MRRNILIVGQVPPPYHGQATIIGTLLAGQYRRVTLHSVRMSFSENLADVGRPTFGKLMHLMSLVSRIVFARLRTGSDVLYYPPSGKGRFAVYRDIIVLVCVRWMFRRTVFHFLAGGTSEFLRNAGVIEALLFRWGFGSPDATIRPSRFSPDDGNAMRTRQDIVIPWGVDDLQTGSDRRGTSASDFTVLFAGLLVESKGILILLEAFRRLTSVRTNVVLNILGEFRSDEMRIRTEAFVRQHGLGESVRFQGLVTGDLYHKHFSNADVFCFPSFYEMENLPVVLIDALQHGLPVVTTRWRGIPEAVRDGENGFLVETQNVSEVLERLIQLYDSRQLRQSMGNASRRLFEAEFTSKGFLDRMEEVFANV